MRYVIEELGRNGTKDRRAADIEKDEIIIGRGVDCDIRLASSYVALRHAKIGFTEGQIYIEDPGSLSSITVNEKVEKYKVLREGDRVKLADVSLDVAREDGVWTLVETRAESDSGNIEEIVERQAAGLTVAKSMPSMKVLSIGLFAIISALYFAWPFISGRQDSWSSGPISSHHSMIGSDCTACHAGGFTPVKDEQCLACHSMTDHAEFLKDHRELEGRCASCHMEHNGNHGIVLNDSRLCIDCHADINKIYPDSKRHNVPNFDNHPEFTVSVQPLSPDGEVKRVQLSDSQNLKDNSFIKLNHKIHLEAPIRSKDGMVQLGCRDCHNASKDRESMVEISFDKHCRSCHSLEFDPRLKGVEAPHGDADVVYNFLYAEYAKLLLGSDDPISRQEFSRRAKPGSALPSVAAAPSSRDDFKQSLVEGESRGAEQELFTRTACHLCHEIAEKPEPAAGSSRFEVIKPRIPADWMPEVRFDHGSHEAIKCDDCHKGVYQSEKTNEVLLPSVNNCRICHSGAAKHGLVQSDCVMCHSYHDQQLVGADQKRNIEAILKVKSPL